MFRMIFKKNTFSTVCFVFLATLFAHGQEDTKDKTKSIKINAKKSSVLPAKSLEMNANNGFKNAYKNTQARYKKIAAEKALQQKGIITPKMLNKQRFDKNLERNNLKVPMIDRDLGAFKTTSEFLYVRSSDFGQIDGDVVSIYKNGKIIVDSYMLTATVKTFKIRLEKGFNNIEIIATDEGTLRPNTGHFILFDDLKQTFISDLWHLAKGAKVYAMIIRE